jgi:hypothetical protein
VRRRVGRSSKGGVERIVGIIGRRSRLTGVRTGLASSPVGSGGSSVSADKIGRKRRRGRLEDNERSLDDVDREEEVCVQENLEESSPKRKDKRKKGQDALEPFIPLRLVDHALEAFRLGIKASPDTPVNLDASLEVLENAVESRAVGEGLEAQGIRSVKSEKRRDQDMCCPVEMRRKESSG